MGLVSTSRIRFGVRRSATAAFIGRRLVQMIFTMIVVILVNFLLLHAAPGDVVDVIAVESQIGDPEQLQQLREEYGLDRPIIVQLLNYYGRVLQLDLGQSVRLNEPVLNVVVSRLPATILLMIASVTLAFCGGTILGSIAARKLNSFTDTAICISAMVLYATPSFLAGLLLMLIFSIGLRWLPVTGFTTPGADLTLIPYMLDVGMHLIMPALALSLVYLAVYTRLMRATMLEILNLDYIRTARAKGLTARQVIYRHAVKNAMPSMVVMCGLQLSALFGGTVIVETIFGWPGMGLLAYNAVFQRDFSLLLGILFLSSIIVMLVSLFVDLMLMWLDPRVVPK